MEQIIEKEKCVGCAACSDACNRNAIGMQTDEEGFAYPKIIRQKCTDCWQCKNVCPAFNPGEAKKNSFAKPIVYAARHRNLDIRKASTSGGLFSALAECAYSQNMVVGGAVWTEDFLTKHFISDSKDDLQRIRGSKYFQSDMQGFYKSVKEQLKAGKKVLVCAMSCQIAGLQNYFKDCWEDIIFVDTICTGINSPMVWKKFLQGLEQEYKGKILKIRAKAKDWGWRALAHKIEFDNGKIYHKFSTEDDWVRGYIGAHAYIRPCCHDCQFNKTMQRIADITLGDFWGVENTDSKLDDNLGTSVVLVNTEKGKAFFENCKGDLDIEERSFSEIISGNMALFSSAKPFEKRVQFFEYIKNHSFAKAARKFFPRKKFIPKLAKIIKWVFKNFWNVKFRYSKPFKKQIFISDSNCALDIHRTAKIELQGIFKFGYKRNRRSKLESALLLEKNSEFCVGKSVTVVYGADFQVFKNAKLAIGVNTAFNRNVQIICMERIEIGRNCLVSRDVVIRDNDGGHKILTDGYKTTSPIKIGDYVWIGHGAMIMKGVTIGDGAIIGAGALVVGNVKPNTVVMGDPARMIQKEVIWMH